MHLFPLSRRLLVWYWSCARTTVLRWSWSLCINESLFPVSRRSLVWSWSCARCTWTVIVLRWSWSVYINESLFPVSRRSLVWSWSCARCTWTMIVLRWSWSRTRRRWRNRITFGRHWLTRSGWKSRCSSKISYSPTTARKTSMYNTWSESVCWSRESNNVFVST